jgi:hypothetical protein
VWSFGCGFWIVCQCNSLLLLHCNCYVTAIGSEWSTLNPECSIVLSVLVLVLYNGLSLVKIPSIWFGNVTLSYI